MEKIIERKIAPGRLRTYTRDNIAEDYTVVYCEYDGARRIYRPNILSDILVFTTAQEARAWCREHGWPVSRVERVGSRFQSGWGIIASHAFDPQKWLIGSDMIIVKEDWPQRDAGSAPAVMHRSGRSGRIRRGPGYTGQEG